jgi:hypothetical protein
LRGGPPAARRGHLGAVGSSETEAAGEHGRRRRHHERDVDLVAGLQHVADTAVQASIALVQAWVDALAHHGAIRLVDRRRHIGSCPSPVHRYPSSCRTGPCP